MMKSVVASIVLAIAAAGASAATVSTFVGSIGNHNYYVVTDEDNKLLWTEAEAAAVALGGHLAAINSAAEEAWLGTKFASTERLWIGFTDQAVEGTWKWINGDAVTYTHWAGGEPNSGGGGYEEDWAVINWEASGAWNDLPNNGAGFGGGHRGIVEVVPEPGTLALVALALIGIGAIRRRT